MTNYENANIAETADLLRNRFDTLSDKRDILKAVELKALYGQISTMQQDDRAAYGQELNRLKQELTGMVESSQVASETLPPIDVTAPFDTNIARADRPQLLGPEPGSRHPLMVERDEILDIFYRMGFTASESREIDDDYHMFGALNFPEGHPARDDYDTFMTEQTAGSGPSAGKRFIAPAHTSTMQNRLLKKYAANLEHDTPIAVVVPDRVFRNEDLDARHEHTFYQVEGVFVDKGIHAGIYSGFAWGFGIERLVMLKHNIEDVRHFESGKLDFLRQFA